MKISKEIPKKDIPPIRNPHGRLGKPEYDNLAKKVLVLETDKSIPVECKSKRELDTVTTSMRKRGFQVNTRGLTAYVSNKEQAKK